MKNGRGFARLVTKIAIVGTGPGGLGVCGQLIRQKIVAPKEITLLDPNPYHIYTGYGTMIGGGLLGDNREQIKKINSLIARPTAGLLPNGVNLLAKAAIQFQPENNIVLTQDGTEVEYKCLICSPGLKHDFSVIKGAEEHLNNEKSPVASIFYKEMGAHKMNYLRQQDKDGAWLFSNGPPGSKCWGAPFKVCLLVEDYLRRTKKRAKKEIHFFNTGEALYPVEEYGSILKRIAIERGIHLHFHEWLQKIEANKAIFKNKITGEITTYPYEVLHFTPHFNPRDVIRNSPLSDSGGLIPVNPETLQHTKFENVFALGDATNLKVAKTAAAITVQAPVIVHNVHCQIQNRSLEATYDGYSVCPIFTARQRMLFAEAKWGKPSHSYFTKHSRPKRLYFFVCRYLMPYLYWFFLPRGLWYGKRIIFKPRF